MHLGWARPIVERCKAAGTKLFVKQLGARPVRETKDDRLWNIGISRKGGNPADWPVSLWVGSTEMNVAILPVIAIHPDVERWAIKTSVPAGAYTKNATWVGLAGGLREGSRVWTTGHLTLAALEPDGDFQSPACPRARRDRGVHRRIHFYDSHVGNPPRGKGGQKPTTLWEIHPVVYEVLR